MITAIYNFFRHETDRFVIGGVYIPAIEFNLSVQPFNWLQFSVGHPWINSRFGLECTGPTAFWLIVGPLDISVSW